MKKLLIYTLFILFGSVSGMAQEQIYIHFDKPFYTTGEVMWYKLYFPKSLSDKEFTIKVALTDSEGKIKESWFLESKGDGQSNGYIKIPFNWSSDNYAFHLTGLDNTTKKSVRIGHVVIPILNDLEVLSTSAGGGNMTKAPSASPMKVFVGKPAYAPGSEVTAEVSSNIATGQKSPQLSVSVVDAELTKVYGSAVKSIRWNGNSDLGNQFFLEGRITDGTGGPMNTKVFGAYTPLEDKIYYLKTDENGYFTLRAPSFKGNRAFQFIANEGSPAFDVQLDEGIAGIQLDPLVVTEAVMEYVQLSRDRKKITQYFGQSKDPIAKEPITFKKKKEKPENSYKIAEYQAFENIAEFFIEIRSPLTFKLDRDTMLLASISKPVEYYTVRGQKDEPPIFIIDGKMTKDAHYVGQTRLELINSADLFYNPTEVNRKYKTLGSGGVVKLYSKDNNYFLSPEEERHIVAVSGVLLEGSPKARVDLDSGKPWYTPQVFWSPNLVPNAQGRANISFQQSDDISTFVIQVVGIKEDGSLAIGDQQFEVR